MKIDNKSFQHIDAPGNYWFLFFIGSVIYEQGKLGIEHWFVNTNEPNDRFFNDQFVVKKTFEISCLAISTGYNLGCIFNRDGNLVGNSLNYESEKIDIQVNANYSFCSRPVLISNNIELFPFLPFSELRNFRYYYFVKDGIKIILPVVNVLKQFFFIDSRITELLLTEETINNLFPPQYKEIRKNDAGAIVGHFLHDNRVSNEAAKHLGRFLFTKDGIGCDVMDNLLQIIDTKLIGSRLNSEGITSRLTMAIPLSCNMKFSLTGKKFASETGSVFLAYQIYDMKILDKESPYTVNEITHSAITRRESSDQRESKATELYRGNVSLTIKPLDEYETHPESQNKPFFNKEGYDFFVFNDDLVSEKTQRTDQENQYVKVDDNFSFVYGATLNSAIDPNSTYNRLNLKSTMNISLKWDDLVVQVLDNLVRQKGVSYNIITRNSNCRYFFFQDKYFGIRSII